MIPDGIPAVQYTRQYYESASDKIHDMSYIITEIFIPSMEVIFNTKREIYYSRTCHSDSPIAGVTDIVVPKEFAKRIAEIAKLKLEVSKRKEEVTPDLDQFWREKGRTLV
jgi:hypothetical protein